MCHDAVEATKRRNNELGKMAPRATLRHYAGFCEVRNSYIIYNIDKDDIFYSPWALTHANESTLRHIVSEHDHDYCLFPDYLTCEEPIDGYNNTLSDFPINCITDINVTYSLDDRQTYGTVVFKTDNQH